MSDVIVGRILLLYRNSKMRPSSGNIVSKITGKHSYFHSCHHAFPCHNHPHFLGLVTGCSGYFVIFALLSSVANTICIAFKMPRTFDQRSLS